MRYVTQSEAALARRCWRKWYLTHYRTIRGKAETINESRLIGTLCHSALEQWYSFGQDPLATIIYDANILLTEQETRLATAGEGARVVIERNLETIVAAQNFATIIIEGYLEWLVAEGADQHLTLISAEEEVAVMMPIDNLPQPVSLLSKLDARFYDERSGARVFMDHKTVDRFADRERWAHLDPQFLFYSLVEWMKLKSEKPDDDPEWTDGGILNMLRKVKRTSRSNPPFYKRKEVRHSLIELTHYFTRITGEITDILQKTAMLDSGVDHHLVCPPNPTRDCSWDCSFMTLCAFMDDGSDVEGYIEASFDVVNPIDRYKSVSGLRVV